LTDYKLGEWLEVSATGGASRLPYKKKENDSKCNK